MMRKLQDAYPERRDELMELLGVDPEWRMHRVSDGQRRRVQLLLGLVRLQQQLLRDEEEERRDAEANERDVHGRRAGHGGRRRRADEAAEPER